ncbi:MAG: hypothetical protein ABI838_03445 [Chloroflexota bacterium]
MDDLRIEIFTPREKRVAAAVALAVLAILASALYLMSSPLAGEVARRAGGDVVSPPPADQRWASFHFVSPTRGYAIAGILNSETTLQKAYRTTDGARTWQLLPLPAGARGQASSMQTLANGGLLLDTEIPLDTNSQAYWYSGDGGSTWRRFPIPAQAGTPSLQLLDARMGVLVIRPRATAAVVSGISMYWTHDAGATWRQTLSLDAEHPTAGALDVASPYLTPTFTDDHDGWLMTGSFVPRPGVRRPALLRTSDGGATWAEVAFEAPPDRSYSLTLPVFPAGDDHGYLALSGSSGLAIYESLDAGRTWSSPYQSTIRRFSVAPDRWLSAAGDLLFISRDWGRSWSWQKGRLPPHTALGYVEAIGSVLWSYDSPGARNAQAQANLMRSNDGGGTWTQLRWPGA